MKTTNDKSFRSWLIEHNACSPAVAWVGRQSLEAAWRLCDRGDWMIWLAMVAGVDRRIVVGAVCECVRPALVHVSNGEDRPRVAIETTEAWCRGEATIEDVRRASYAGHAVRAAYTAVYAARAATSHTSDAAAAYASEAAYAAAYAESLAQSAAIVRSRIPLEMVQAAMEES